MKLVQEQTLVTLLHNKVLHYVSSWSLHRRRALLSSSHPPSLRWCWSHTLPKSLVVLVQSCFAVLFDNHGISSGYLVWSWQSSTSLWIHFTHPVSLVHCCFPLGLTLLLYACNATFIADSTNKSLINSVVIDNLIGQIFTIMILTVAAAESANHLKVKICMFWTGSKQLNHPLLMRDS